MTFIQEFKMQCIDIATSLVSRAKQRVLLNFRPGFTSEVSSCVWCLYCLATGNAKPGSQDNQ